MRRTIRLVLAATASALAATAGTAKADLLPSLTGGNCGSTSAVFSPWSDPAVYYLAANGGFENGTTGWTVTGAASVVTGNEPFKLAKDNGTHALQLGAGASASITTCYGLTYPAVRFVATGVNGTATIHVRVYARSLLGVLSVLDGGRFSVGSQWQPSAKLSTLFSALAAPLGTKTMQLQITVESGTARIDDLYVDPFLTKS